MEFLKEKDGIDGGIWVVKTDAAELCSAASEREARVKMMLFILELARQSGV